MTDDSNAARGEDQVAPERSDMAPKGGKGPSAASAADTQGAFGDSEQSAETTYSSVDKTLIKGLKTGEGGKE